VRVSRRILLAGSLVVAAGVALAAALGRTADCQTTDCEREADGARDPITLEVAPPERLSDTGLYADATTRTIARGVRSFSPQYPLWTDGAEKRRFIRVPAGKGIDARYPYDWRFPVGTKLWKEFAFGDTVETRYMERLEDGRWILAAYAWNADGRDATLVPRGARGVREIAPGVRHDIPSRMDCLACHDGRTTPVLGFTALQLSPDRDPLAPHADAPAPGSLDLASLAAAGLLRDAPTEWASSPPRIAARTPRARAALGYLHANCATCHRAEGDLRRLALSFEPPLDGSHGAPDERPAPAARTTVGVPSRFHPPGLEDAPVRVAPGDPDRSVLLRRMRSRLPAVQMPPLGTHLVDRDGVDLIERFIREDLAPATPDAPR
jgi:hypothetical protein